jgi:CDP-glucose 4,6-dehydratase
VTYFQDDFRGRSVLITGHTGFKGSWLSAWLLRLGANVTGFSNCIPTTPSHFEAAGFKARLNHVTGDVRDANRVCKLISERSPDFVFHLAAQPLVRLSYQDPRVTLETNFMGTVNLLEALRNAKRPCIGVFITSDKCYDNVEQVWGYRENDRLGGKDPYSASKGAAELAIRTYAQSFFAAGDSPVRIGVCRAGNVIGGGDWAADRVVPDSVRAWSQGKSVSIRKPRATRPWQHVLEPLSGYLTLASRLVADGRLNGEPFNFGPPADQNHAVAELLEEMKSHWPSATWTDAASPGDLHEAGLLKLCCDKAQHELGWRPVLNFTETVRFTSLWYRSYYEGQGRDMWQFTQRQIADYEVSAGARAAIWASK